MRTSIDPTRGPKPSAADVKLLSSHPLVRNKAYLPTPPIRRVYAEIAEAVAERDGGLSFVAFSRFGKTFAINVLSAQLAVGFPDVPILCTNATEHARFSEATFYSELLQGCTRAPVAQAKALVLRNKLIRFLWAIAESTGSDRIVLFVDEAQNWAEPEFTSLRDISNDLALLADVLLVVNLFGAPMLANTRSTLLQAGRTDLVGRFMVRQFGFEGIRSTNDLAQTMICYDDVEISEYPSGTGVSFSEFFMPIAFSDGWRLQHESTLCWETFQKVARPRGGVEQVGMKWVASAIRRFLTVQSESDRAHYRGTEKDWEAAIYRCGFAQSIGVTYSTETNLAVEALNGTAPEAQ